MIKQRAMLKAILIREAKRKPFYGLQIRDIIHKEFQDCNYYPGHSEVYKALYSLIDDEILKSSRIYSSHNEYQTSNIVREHVLKYFIANEKLADSYLSMYQEDIDNTMKLLEYYQKKYKS